MNEEALERERVVNRERVIEEAIMRRPDKLGYPDARSIRNWRVARACGLLDVGLLPLKGPKKLVLVEAKSVYAPDAASKVVGQLLMYYAGALTLGAKGLACLRAFAGRMSTAYFLIIVDRGEPKVRALPMSCTEHR